MPMMNCLFCQAEQHILCLRPENVDGISACCCGPEVVTITAESARGGPTKDAEDMRDPLSTGRKRAANVKPIEEGMVCEWAKLRKAGGGVIPIVGCAGNPARHIHHGPDKDTTNNALTNLHRVCADCHNRWHSLNDKFYGERPGAGTPFVPIEGQNQEHNPEDAASLEEIYEHELWWRNSKRTTPYINLPEVTNDEPALTG